jgi:hypothetical protein
VILFVQCDIVTVRKKLQVYNFFQLKIVELHGFKACSWWTIEHAGSRSVLVLCVHSIVHIVATTFVMPCLNPHVHVTKRRDKDIYMRVTSHGPMNLNTVPVREYLIRHDGFTFA